MSQDIAECVDVTARGQRIVVPGARAEGWRLYADAGCWSVAEGTVFGVEVV